jgi:hypothetical protein
MPFYIVELISSDNLTLPMSAIPLEPQGCSGNTDPGNSAALIKITPTLMPLAVILGIVSGLK